MPSVPLLLSPPVPAWLCRAKSQDIGRSELSPSLWSADVAAPGWAAHVSVIVFDSLGTIRPCLASPCGLGDVAQGEGGRKRRALAQCSGSPSPFVSRR